LRWRTSTASEATSGYKTSRTLTTSRLERP
jgi:hypothetical protein